MVIGVAFVAFVAGVFYSAGLLLSTPIQLCRKNKKAAMEKGLIFAHHFGVVRCEKARATEWDGNMPWHHEGN